MLPGLSWFTIPRKVEQPSGTERKSHMHRGNVASERSSSVEPSILGWHGSGWLTGWPALQAHSLCGEGTGKQQCALAGAQPHVLSGSHAASARTEIYGQMLEKVVCSIPHTEENHSGWAVEKKVHSPEGW